MVGNFSQDGELLEKYFERIYIPLIINKEPDKNLTLYGAGDEARTRDILLGKEAFYH